MKSQIHVALVLAAMIALALLADAWRSAHRDSEQLSAVVASQNAQIQKAGENEKQRDAQLAATLAAIEVKKRSVQNPEQAAKQLAQALPPLPLPVSVHIPNLSAPVQTQRPAPSESDPETTIAIPEPDVIPLYNELQNCRASQAETSTLQQDLADEKGTSAAIRRERDAALTAARGGTMVARLKRSAKWFAIGVATGAAIAASTHR